MNSLCKTIYRARMTWVMTFLWFYFISVNRILVTIFPVTQFTLSENFDVIHEVVTYYEITLFVTLNKLVNAVFNLQATKFTAHQIPIHHNP